MVVSRQKVVAEGEVRIVVTERVKFEGAYVNVTFFCTSLGVTVVQHVQSLKSNWLFHPQSSRLSKFGLSIRVVL